MEYYGPISTIPILVLIVGALITKKLTEMLLFSTFVGAIILYGGGFFSGYIELLYKTLAGESFQFLFLILIGCGPLITLFERSGSLLGFSKSISKFATTQKRSLFATWVLGVIIFIDDYLNALAVSAAMKNITDKLGVPREHLAYTVNSTGACICVLVPFTSWVAFATGCMKAENLGFADYLGAIPFMFYPWAAVTISLLLGIGLFPKIGPIKKAYQRVAEGGPTTVPIEKDGPASIVNIQSSTDIPPRHPVNFLLPIIALVAAMIIFGNDLIHGLIAAIVVQAILYLAQKIFTPTQFMNVLLEGVTSMANLIFVILIAFTLAGINEILDFSGFMIGIFTNYVSPSFLPAITFLLCAWIAFASCSFWALIVVAMPIFVPLAINLDLNPSILIAGIMSGVALGSQACFYSDAVFMTAAGTGVSNLPQVRAALPYVGIGVIAAVILFLVVGFVY